MSEYPKLRLRQKEERRLLSGHLWAFSNELVEIPKDVESGSIVTLVRETDGSFVGHAFYNPHSLIAARIVSRNSTDVIDDAFFEKKIVEAVSKRALLLTRRNAVRLVHGESDLLPGLIIDRFGDVIAFQITSAGFEVRKEMIVEVIRKHLQPKSIVEKNNSSSRKLEGLDLKEEVVFGAETEVEIHDAAGTKFRVDVLAGQKTGFFLDQMDNRSELRKHVNSGDKVLDLFSNEGGFGLNAALAGASSVVAVDASKEALGKVESNAELNSVSSVVTTIATDIFKPAADLGNDYDLVILDPPALAKGKKDLHNARHGYLSLNLNAMKRVRPGGLLLSASCSHHVSREMLLEVISEAGRKAKRTLTLLEERGAGIDHPILLAMPETAYLKVFILRVG